MYKGQYCTKCKIDTGWSGGQESELTSNAFLKKLCPRCNKSYDSEILFEGKTWQELIELLSDSSKSWANDWKIFDSSKNRRSFNFDKFASWLTDFTVYLLDNRQDQQIFDHFIARFIKGGIGQPLTMHDFQAIKHPELFHTVNNTLVRQFSEYESYLACVAFCPADILESYFDSPITSTQIALALNWFTPKVHLEHLSHSAQPSILKALCRNPNAPVGFLWKQLELQIPIGHFAGEWDVTSFHIAADSLARSQEVSVEELKRLLDDPRHGSQKLHFYSSLAQRIESNQEYFEFVWRSHLQDYDNQPDWVFMQLLKDNSSFPSHMRPVLQSSILQRYKKDEAKGRKE